MAQHKPEHPCTCGQGFCTRHGTYDHPRLVIRVLTRRGRTARPDEYSQRCGGGRRVLRKKIGGQ